MKNPNQPGVAGVEQAKPIQPDPVDPNDYLNKTILYQIVNTPYINRGIIRRISKHGLLEIEEIIIQNGNKITNTTWHLPQNVYIMDVLDE